MNETQRPDANARSAVWKRDQRVQSRGKGIRFIGFYLPVNYLPAFSHDILNDVAQWKVAFYSSSIFLLKLCQISSRSVLDVKMLRTDREIELLLIGIVGMMIWNKKKLTKTSKRATFNFFLNVIVHILIVFFYIIQSSLVVKKVNSVSKYKSKYKYSLIFYC